MPPKLSQGLKTSVNVELVGNICSVLLTRPGAHGVDLVLVHGKFFYKKGTPERR